MTDPRAEDALDIPLGSVVSSEDGTRYVFVGWFKVTTGREAWFVADASQRGKSSWTYRASMYHTLERKFPDIRAFRRSEL